jgi:putative CocE/NonD family hydrolase
VVKFRLLSHGHANTSSGDGVLVANDGDDDDAGGTPDHFVYDPTNPVPTTGGNMCCNGVVPNGARDQSAVELRDDVLVYTSEPLRHDMAVIGTVNATFWAETSAPDTDFTVKLVDVHPDGLTHNVLDRIVRARYRLGSKLPPSLIQPGKPYRYTLELGNTATVLRAGHQVRVEVSSSNFPHFARNLNTSGDLPDEVNPRKAMQTILHDPRHPSYVELPVAHDVTLPMNGSSGGE